MDANNTTFRQLISEADWGTPGELEAAALEWDPIDGALRLQKSQFVFPSAVGSQTLIPDARRGAARDIYGNVFWVNESRDGIKMSDVDGNVRDWWPTKPGKSPTVSPGQFRPVDAAPSGTWQLRGLCVTCEHYLLIGVREDPMATWSGLLAFDLHAGGVPLELRWPVDQDCSNDVELGCSPLDLCAAPDGGAWLLDGNGGRRLWRLDRNLQVKPLGQMQDGCVLQPARRFDFVPEGSNPQAPTTVFPTPRLLWGQQVHAIQALANNQVLALITPEITPEGKSYPSRVLWLAPDREEPWSASIDNEALAPYLKREKSFRAHDFVHIPDPNGNPGRLYFVEADGNQVYAFELKIKDNNTGFRLTLTNDYFPLMGYTGRQLIAATPPKDDTGPAAPVDDLDARHAHVYYDHGERWLPLVAKHQPNYESQGVFTTRVFHSERQACVWHRVIVDARIPAETSVSIESRCADAKKDLQNLPWQHEPPLYQRKIGSELPGHEAFLHDGCAPGADAGSWELLLQQAQGRYLQLRLTLTGNQRRTPRIRALRVWMPRFSYLHEYLPAVYREDPGGASFLDRYLANIEGLFTTWEDRIAAAQLWLDAQTAPAEFLDWLAGWLGLSLNPNWDTGRRRLLLRFASQLFRQRGTPEGMVRSLRLALDPEPDASLFEQDVISGVQCVRVVEHFTQRPAVRSDLLADTLTLRAYLLEAWRKWAEAEWKGMQPPPEFPATSPSDPQRATVWRRFLREELAFHYAEVDAENSEDRQAWQRFLVHRHGRLDRATEIHGDSFGVKSDKEDTPLPPSGQAFEDWMAFVTTYLPAHRAAHRFSVLVPTPHTRDQTALKDWFARVEQVVRQAMPAHTSFELQVYSGLFRVGAARVGLDTVLEERALTGSASVDYAVLGEAALTLSYPYDLQHHRRVLRQSGDCAPT